MKTAATVLACVLCAAPVVFAQQYDDESRDYDRGQGGAYPYRDTEATDWYRDTDRGMRDDALRDRSWRQGQFDPRTGQYYGRPYDRDSGTSQYGYRGTEDYDQGYGQDWRQRDQFRANGRRADTFDQRMGRQPPGRMGGGQSIAVIGQLTNEDARVTGANPNHKVVQVRTLSGSTLYVDLGPTQQTENLDLSPNQSIFARGRLTSIGGQRVLMAHEIARVSQRITLERFGPGQQERDIYGYTDDQSAQQDKSGGQQDQSQQFRSQNGQKDSGKDKSKWNQFQKQPDHSGESSHLQQDSSGSGSTGESGR
jgi:hypothetical protein